MIALNVCFHWSLDMKRVPPLPVEYSLLFEIDLSSDIAGHTINEAVPGMHLP